MATIVLVRIKFVCYAKNVSLYAERAVLRQVKDPSLLGGKSRMSDGALLVRYSKSETCCKAA